MENLCKIIPSFCSGYMAPEYAMRGYLTDKADVTVLELLPSKLSVEEETLLIGQKRNAFIFLIG